MTLSPSFGQQASENGISAWPGVGISVVFRDGEAVVSVGGELDIIERDSFVAVMDQVRDRHPRRIVVDLANLDFLD